MDPAQVYHLTNHPDYMESAMTAAHLENSPLPCNRCGACCMVGGPCDLLGAVTGERDFTGRCPALVDEANGTKTCGVYWYVDNPVAFWADTGRRWTPGAQDRLRSMMVHCDRPDLYQIVPKQAGDI